MKSTPLYISTLIAPVFLLAACGGKQKQAPAMPPTAVNVVEVKKTAAIYYDQYPASVVPLQEVEIRAQVGGYLTGIFFKEGQVVQKGQKLYEIDQRIYQAAYNQAQAAVLSAEATYLRAKKDADRYQKLSEQDAIAKQTLDNSIAELRTTESQLASAKAGLQSAKTDLSFAVIRAPFTGKIGISQVRLGAQIATGTTLLNTISTENPIAVDFVVDENSIPRFSRIAQEKNNPKDSVFILQLGDGTLYKSLGQLQTIDRAVDNQTGTIRVRVVFPNPSNELKAGMTTVLRVRNADSGEQLLVPYKAVTEQMGEYFLYTLQDTVAKRHKVVLGPQAGPNVVIKSGLEEGEKVIFEGIQRLQDGAPVTTGQAPAPAQGGAPAGGAAAPKDGQKKK
ncbi:MAG: efflux RND transporter periplasmic adaptor subunit [Mucilaginibacter polytrichastri]|nr:efflux RND transporter periplasmic adaptor subunit [Mucilaginibacter polytrichastri]